MNNNNQIILACIDGSHYSETVSDYAAWASKKLNTRLKLLHSLEPEALPVVTDLSGSIGLGAQEGLLAELTEIEQKRNQLLIKQGKALLQSAESKALAAGVADVIVNQRREPLQESVVALEPLIKLLVMGVRGEKHDDTNSGIGHQLESIIRSLHKAILVVEDEFKEPEQVMLAYDGGESSKKALEWLCQSSLFSDLTVHILYVGTENSNARDLLSGAEEELRQSGHKVVTHCAQGKLEQCLMCYQQDNDIDMIVMGAFSHSRIHDVLLGSLTYKMLKKAQIPLLLVR